jgi:hypothetical protein
VTDSDDTVLAAVPRSVMGPLLTEIHRAGFGHLTKVLDATRSPIRAQLERAGVSPPPEFEIHPDHVLVMISAPARIALALDLVERRGAARTWTVRRSATPWPMFKTPLSARARAARPAESTAIPAD